MRSTTIPLLLTTAVAVALTVACGAENEPVAADRVTVLVAEPQDAGMDALAVGLLADVGGCLGVRDSVVVFPAGTEVLDEEPLRVDLPEVGERGLDDEVELGGGYVYEPSSDGPAGPAEVAGVAIPRGCRDRPIFLASPF